MALKYRRVHLRQSDLLLLTLDPAFGAGGCEEFGLGADDVFVYKEHLFIGPNEDRDLIGEVAGPAVILRAYELRKLFARLRQCLQSEFGIALLVVAGAEIILRQRNSPFQPRALALSFPRESEWTSLTAKHVAHASLQWPRHFVR